MDMFCYISYFVAFYQNINTNMLDIKIYHTFLHKYNNFSPLFLFVYSLLNEELVCQTL